MVDKTWVTAADFLQMPESNQIIQLIKGEIVTSPAPLLDHQRIVGAVYRLLLGLIPDGEVFIAPVDVHLDDANVLQPDVFWVSDENGRCMSIEGRYFKGAPDLCVEVLSPRTARQDRTVKFLLYEHHGIREYWIIDPATKTLEVWVLNEGQFMLQGSFTALGAFPCAALGGARVAVDALF